MVLDPYGKTFTFDVKEQLMGLQTGPLSAFMVKQYDLPITCEEYARLQRLNAEKLMRDAQLMPGTNARVPFAVTFQTRREYTRRYIGK